MQVFIIGSPLSTARALDKRRLNKQIIECEQILSALNGAKAWLRKCWKNKEGCIDGFCIEPYAAAYRYGFTISRVPTGSHICNETNVYPNKVFETYEEAVEAALKYTLENLI